MPKGLGGLGLHSLFLTVERRHRRTGLAFPTASSSSSTAVAGVVIAWSRSTRLSGIVELAVLREAR